MNNLNDSVRQIHELTAKLEQFDCISKFNTHEENEAVRLAHSLTDLGNAFAELTNNLLPALYLAETNEAAHNALIDIGEELRHVLYHIRDPGFFAYLFEE